MRFYPDPTLAESGDVAEVADSVLGRFLDLREVRGEEGGGLGVVDARGDVGDGAAVGCRSSRRASRPSPSAARSWSRRLIRTTWTGGACRPSARDSSQAEQGAEVLVDGCCRQRLDGGAADHGARIVQASPEARREPVRMPSSSVGPRSEGSAWRGRGPRGRRSPSAVGQNRRASRRAECDRAPRGHGPTSGIRVRHRGLPDRRPIAPPPRSTSMFVGMHPPDQVRVAEVLDELVDRLLRPVIPRPQRPRRLVVRPCRRSARSAPARGRGRDGSAALRSGR